MPGFITFTEVSKYRERNEVQRWLYRRELEKLNVYFEKVSDRAGQCTVSPIRDGQKWVEAAGCRLLL